MSLKTYCPCGCGGYFEGDACLMVGPGFDVCNHCGLNPSSPPNPWRAAREAKGWTTREAADAAGVSKSLVSRIENGKEVEFRAGVALARAYGVSAEELLAATPPPQRKRHGQRVSGRPISKKTLELRREAFAMRKAGKTFHEIGLALGFSQQRAEQLVAAQRLTLDPQAD